MDSAFRDRVPLKDRFAVVENLTKRGILGKDTALKLIRVEYRKATLSEADRELLCELHETLAKA